MGRNLDGNPDGTPDVQPRTAPGRDPDHRRSIHVLYNLPVRFGTKLCLAAALLWLSCLGMRAESVSQLQPSDYVNDFAHVLDQKSIAEMDDICGQIDRNAHAQIAVVTINTLDGADIESFAADLYKKWGVGSKSTNRGVLILYAINDHGRGLRWVTGWNRFCPTEKSAAFSEKPSR